jgi:hypothetical protein
MEMKMIMEYIGLMGIGALLHAIVQHILYRRDKALDRKDQEKKEAYAGFLDAIFALRDNKELTEPDVNLRYWVARVQLVCSKEILEWLIELEGCSRNAITTKLKLEAVVLAMRWDLGIEK